MAAPNILCDCTGMTNEMWLKCREHGPKGNIEYTVGGSDVATIFGLSPWTTPLELWMVKKGRMKPKSPPNRDQLAMGHMLEPIAAHFYAQRTGNTVTDDNYLYQHATLEYALANIDRRYTRKEDGEGGVLECKSLTYHKAADWADGAIPIYYELQLRYYLAVLDEKHGAFSALWGNNPENDLATPHIERVQAKEDIIFEKLDRWIWSLRHDKPPTMEDVQPQLAMDALARIYGAGKKGLPTIEFPRKYEPQLRKIAALQEENAQLKGAIKKNEEAILTLFAIAKELEKSGNISPMVEADLAVGLPPEHYALRQRFADYFKRGRVNFVFNGAPICLMIRHVFVYPQAYAAVVPQAGRLKEIPRTFIIDIGGYTTDVMLLRNAAPDLQFCRSLEMGVIPMSNDIISRVSAMYDIKIEDDHIADIIQGRPTILPQEVRDVIFAKVRSYACDILDKLRELQVDLRANPAIFIGGGSILFRSFVEESPLVAHADFVTDPKANAIGYGMLATAQLRRMAPQNHGGEFFAQG